MFDNIFKFFKKIGKKEPEELTSKDMAKERLHLVLMQDRANVSADFLDMMKQEIIDVIKKYIDVNEDEIDVRLTNKMNEDGTVGAPALYANIPIAGVKSELQNPPGEAKIDITENKEKEPEKKEVVKEENKDKKVEEKKAEPEEKSDKKDDVKEAKKIDDNSKEKVEEIKAEEKTKTESVKKEETPEIVVESKKEEKKKEEDLKAKDDKAEKDKKPDANE